MELIYSRTNDNLDSEILTVIVSTITEISAALNDSPNPRRDFLFYAASFYTKSLVFFSPTHPTSVSAVSTLLEALRNYKAYLGEGVPSLEKILEIPSFSHQKWWEFLTLPEVIPTPSGYASEEKMGTSLSSIPLASRKSTAKEDTSDDIPILRVQPTPYAERD
jgi:hypothetical protein